MAVWGQIGWGTDLSKEKKLFSFGIEWPKLIPPAKHAGVS
jgi:hypothetical protein